jgi:hypothetical protein
MENSIQSWHRRSIFCHRRDSPNSRDTVVRFTRQSV